uniref:GatB/YqeY domain-containing protein n=1 Tax=candidate division CPR3 bacterium TaxID=2268181 RepID=A0A7V3J9T4_UNCC3
MNTLITKIEDDFKAAFKKQDASTLSTLRLLKNAIHNLEIEKQSPLTEEDIWQLINREIKKRKEAISQYKTGKRDDLARKEEEELKVLSSYLPEQLKDAELEAIVNEAIQKTGAQTISDFNRVMQQVMPQVKGKADGSRVAAIVKSKLSK